ncbi:MAG: glycosyltransferase family 4 protein [Armatimonadota bacterium]|nr:glycosyltransferase family 4 protein [Armatimonadota bacterium]
MRLLHLQKVTGIAGSERHLLDLLPGLAARGCEIRMVVLAAGQASRFLATARERGIPVETIPAGPDVNPAIVAALARRIQRFTPDLVHTHLIHADLHGALAAALVRVPTVSSFHGTHPFFERGPVRLAVGLALRRARRVIAISRWVREFLLARGLARPEQVDVVHYGIRAEGWRATRADRERARTALGIDPEECVVGAASRLVPHKGHDTLLRAAARLSDAVPLRVLVAGDGPLREPLQRLASELGLDKRVRFMGFLGDVRPLLHACDVFCMPTSAAFGEGFGLAALEAQAARLPVVASRTASLPEVVAHDETGLLVSPDSAEELAGALLVLARDPGLRARLGEAAARRATEAFGIEVMVNGTLAAYRRALGDRCGSATSSPA